LEPQGIKSMLQCAIMDGDTFRGFVGFDECSANRLWTQGQIDLLDFLAEVLAVFLMKQRSRQQPPTGQAKPPPN
jgi:GAF domain-containing protein